MPPPVGSGAANHSGEMRPGPGRSSGACLCDRIHGAQLARGEPGISPYGRSRWSRGAGPIIPARFPWAGWSANPTRGNLGIRQGPAAAQPRPDRNTVDPTCRESGTPGRTLWAMSDHAATIARPGQLHIAGQADPVKVEATGFIETRETRQVRPLRAPAIPAATLVQWLCGLLALLGLFGIVAHLVDVVLALSVCAVLAGVAGVILSMLREAERI